MNFLNLFKKASDDQKIQDIDYRFNQLIEDKNHIKNSLKTPENFQNSEINIDEKFRRIKENSNLGVDNDWYDRVNNF